ncbi:MAG: hypothetical protein NC548_05795 [Lachnospiraceae bacterium]|nr:hypothetical protein [Lachnospiraceae bacterium]
MPMHTKKPEKLTAPKIIHIPDLGPEYENYMLPIGARDFSQYNQELLDRLVISHEKEIRDAGRVGKTFNAFTVLKYAGASKYRTYTCKYYWCRCVCGSIKILRYSGLSKTYSCGCGGKAQFASESELYMIWYNMNLKCYSPGVHGYDELGGKGIGVCSEWRYYKDDPFKRESAFRNFEQWALANGYQEEMRMPSNKLAICTNLTRIDRSRDFSPDNCIFKTSNDLHRDTRRTHWIAAFGHCFPLVVWSEITGICEMTIDARLRRGWPPEDALATPPYKLPVDGYPDPIIPDKYLKYEKSKEDE